MDKKNINIIGPGILDILINPINRNNIFNSKDVDNIVSSFGGDALNQSVILSRLGKSPNLISKVGNDNTGSQILNFLKQNNISTGNIVVEEGLQTSINIVLVEDNGNRSFISNSKSSLRKLTKKDIIPFLNDSNSIYSFASMFISPLISTDDMIEICKIIKENNNMLIVDVTSPKNNEKLEDLKELFEYIDVFLCNEKELESLTYSSNLQDNILALINNGVKAFVIKRDKHGSIFYYNNQLFKFNAYSVKKAIDTTGAGDSFAAGLIWGLTENLDFDDSIRFATAVASCIVENLGTTNLEDKTLPIERFNELKSIPIQKLEIN